MKALGNAVVWTVAARVIAAIIEAEKGVSG